MPSWLVPHTPFAKTPMATYTRVKTRLQDPPHMIPAFAAQVSQLTRHEQQPAGGEPKSKTTLADQIQHHPQSHLMQKLKAINLAPAPTTVSPKKILRNKKRSLASILSAPYAVHPIPVPEQEVCIFFFFFFCHTHNQHMCYIFFFFFFFMTATDKHIFFVKSYLLTSPCF
jgi:hypothetical protein